MNLERIGEECTILIKKQPWFPYHTGNLKFHATYGRMATSDTYEIVFDSRIAPYVAALEEGSEPHDIPGAFGRKFPFGIGGDFNGKFHPGSQKHKGFISDKSINTIVKFICDNYDGVIK